MTYRPLGPRLHVSKAEAKQVLRIGHPALEELIDDGRLKTLVIGKRTRVLVASLRALLDARLP